MTWLQTTARPRLTRAEAATLRIERTSLVQLGFPRHGGLFTAQAPNLPPLTLVLEQRSE
jgi:hypothetical protein